MDVTQELDFSLVTSGEWAVEADAAREFDERVEGLGLFKLYREVEGYYVQPRVCVEPRRPRIDRILLPKAQLIEMGWRYGAIGVECKASGMKVGPLVAQCADYGRAAFVLPKSGLIVLPTWVFLWPLNDFAGNVASFMDQSRVGGVFGHEWTPLKFKTASRNLLIVGRDGKVDIGDCRQGRKVGSR